MKNADMPAMPIVDSCARPAMYGNEGVEAIGLTKREMMAMHAPEMPGWLSLEWSRSNDGNERYFAK